MEFRLELMPFAAALLVLTTIIIMRLVQRLVQRYRAVGRVGGKIVGVERTPLGGFVLHIGSQYLRKEGDRYLTLRFWPLNISRKTWRVGKARVHKTSVRLWSLRVCREVWNEDGVRDNELELKLGSLVINREVLRDDEERISKFSFKFERETSRDITREAKRQRRVKRMALCSVFIGTLFSTAVYVLGLGLTPGYDGSIWRSILRFSTFVGPVMMNLPFVVLAAWLDWRRLPLEERVKHWYSSAAQLSVRLTGLGIVLGYATSLAFDSVTKGFLLLQQAVLGVCLFARSYIFGAGAEKKAMEAMAEGEHPIAEALVAASVTAGLGEEGDSQIAEEKNLFPLPLIKIKTRDWIWAFMGLFLFVASFIATGWIWSKHIQVGPVNDLLLFSIAIGMITPGIMTIFARFSGVVTELGLRDQKWRVFFNPAPWKELFRWEGWNEPNHLWALWVAEGQVLLFGGIIGNLLSFGVAQWATTIFATHWASYAAAATFSVAQAGFLLAIREFVGGIGGTTSMLIMSKK